MMYKNKVALLLEEVERSQDGGQPKWLGLEGYISGEEETTER